MKDDVQVPGSDKWMGGGTIHGNKGHQRRTTLGEGAAVETHKVIVEHAEYAGL